MSNNGPQIMDSKQKRDQALRLADFKIDDISSVPGDQLLAEVAEDFGHPAFLAAEFDSIAFPVVSRHDDRAVNQDGAAAASALQPAAPGASSFPAIPRPLPAAPWSVPQAALAMLAQWLAVPLRRRVVLGAFAALLLVAALIPGIYPRLIERSADSIATVSKDDPLTRMSAPAPVPTSSQPAPAMNPAPSGSPSQSAAVEAPPPPAPRPRTPPPTEDRQISPPDVAAARAPAPRSMAAAEPPAAPSARGQASPQRQAAAKSRLTEGSGFVVQLSASKSEAEARSTFQALKSKYAVLKGREPVIRRMDGTRGAPYAVQVGPFASQDDADQLCDHLKAAGGSCFTTKN